MTVTWRSRYPDILTFSGRRDHERRDLWRGFHSALPGAGMGGHPFHEGGRGHAASPGGRGGGDLRRVLGVDEIRHRRHSLRRFSPAFPGAGRGRRVGGPPLRCRPPHPARRGGALPFLGKDLRAPPPLPVRAPAHGPAPGPRADAHRRRRGGGKDHRGGGHRPRAHRPRGGQAPERPLPPLPLRAMEKGARGEVPPRRRGRQLGHGQFPGTPPSPRRPQRLRLLPLYRGEHRLRQERAAPPQLPGQLPRAGHRGRGPRRRAAHRPLHRPTAAPCPPARGGGEGGPPPHPPHRHPP